MFREFAAILGLSFAGLAASAAGGLAGPSPATSAITAATVNDAAPIGASDKSPPLIAKAETLLDRAHFSPGEIDGLDGGNFPAPSAPSRRAIASPSRGISTLTRGARSRATVLRRS